MISNEEKFRDVSEEELYSLILRNRDKVKINFSSYVNKKSDLSENEKKGLYELLMSTYLAAMKDVAKYFVMEDLNKIKSEEVSVVDPKVLKANIELEKKIESLRKEKDKLINDRKKQQNQLTETSLPPVSKELIELLQTKKIESKALGEKLHSILDSQKQSIHNFTEKLDSIKSDLAIAKKRKLSGYLTESRSVSPSRKRSYAEKKEM